MKIVTTQDLYQATLFSLQKENIGTVYPKYWNALINVAYNEWLLDKLSNVDKSQAYIDDLKDLTVVTDATQIYNGMLLVPLTGTHNGDHTEFPLLPTGYPEYRRLLNIKFTIEYHGSECHDDGTTSNYIFGRPLKSDEEGVVFDNPYKRPNERRIYYKLYDRIYMYAGDNIGRQAIITYVKQPVAIFFNETSPADTGDPNTGSVNCELGEKQKQELVALATKIYIERVKDERYKTLLQEMMLRLQMSNDK